MAEAGEAVLGIGVAARGEDGCRQGTGRGQRLVAEAGLGMGAAADGGGGWRQD